MRGTLKFFDHDKGFGFIAGPDGNDYYAQAQDLLPNARSARGGDEVNFEVHPEQAGKHRRAIQITLSTRGGLKEFRRTIPRLHASDSGARERELQKKAYAESQDLLKQAIEARKKQEYDRARSLFERALEKKSGMHAFLPYGAMERELAGAGNYDRASRLYERAIQEYPKNGKLYEDYGMLFLRAFPQRAIEIFRHGIERDPSHKILHRYLGQALFATGEQKALAAAEQQFEIAERAGCLDRASQLNKSVIGILRGHPRGKSFLQLMEAVGFRIESVLSHNRPLGFDVVIKSVRAEYEESYDLSGSVLSRCLFKNRPSIADVKQLLDDAGARAANVNRDVIFLACQDAAGIWDYLYRLIEEPGKHPTIVPIQDVLAKSALAEKQPEEKFKLHLDEWLYKRNLYEENFPVSGRRFFGREQELAGLVRSIETGSPVGLFGLRKVGKTSLLRRLVEKRMEDLVVYIDLQSVPEGIKDSEYVYWMIADQIASELSKKRPEIQKNAAFKLVGKFKSFSDIRKPGSLAALLDADLRAIKSALQSGVQGGTPKILILLDEIERLIPTGRSEGFRGFDNFFAYLRGISQSDGVVVSIITGANPALCDTPQWEGRDNPVFKFYREMFLPPLEKRECLEMVERLGRGMGVTYTDNALVHIYNETGGHPFVTRQLCSRISKHFKDRPLRVDVPKVEKGVEEFLFHDSDIFREIIARLERDFPTEKDLLLFIAEGVCKESELSQLVRDGRESLRHLVGYQLVERSDSSYRIKLDLLSNWIKKYWLDENR